MPGAVVHTDLWKGYAGLATAGYRHQVAVISGGSDPAHEVMPRVQVAQAFVCLDHQRHPRRLPTSRTRRDRTPRLKSGFFTDDQVWTQAMPLDYVPGPTRTERNGGPLVRLADDMRKCVVYLGIGFLGNEDEFTPAGTGFVVDTGEPEGSYLVTARHVVEGPDSLGGVPFDIRLNRRGGGARLEHIEDADWVFHSDPTVDIAILPYRPPKWADYVGIPLKMFATEFKLGTIALGAGDLVYVVDVFYLLHGDKENFAYVHTGNIVSMPGDQRIPQEDWRYPRDTGHLIDVEGYLLQVATLPVSSGSPVFARPSLGYAVPDSPEGGKKVPAWVYGSIWLLGVWSGAWDGAPGGIMASLLPKGVPVPIGTGVTAPTSKLVEILEMAGLIDRREEATAKQKRLRAVSPRSALPTKADNPRHREDFNSLLDAAVRRRPKDDRT